MKFSGATSRLLAFFSVIVLVVCFSWPCAKARDFGDKEIVLLNIGIPAILAGLRAYHAGEPVEKAMLQAAFGGYIMQQGFQQAPKLEDRSAWSAWKAKLMVNFGASLAESAGDKFVFRMDIGPVWLVTDGKTVHFKPGLNGVIAPLVHLAEGSKFDFGRSLKYGTMAFERNVKGDGTLNGSGALAYSNANTFTTDANGTHAGHELVHTFQYRRDAMYPIHIGALFSAIDEKIGNNWIDDTSWSVNWGLQCAWADYNGKSKDFDIPMEKEAYYLEQKYRFPNRND